MMGVLESEGIEAVVRKEHLAGLAGQVPFMEAWPEVWIVHDGDLPRAQAIVNRYGNLREV